MVGLSLKIYHANITETEKVLQQTRKNRKNIVSCYRSRFNKCYVYTALRLIANCPILKN